MTRPPLSLALSLVLTARIENADRPGLLATLRPEFGRPPAHRNAEPAPGLARVVPLPRVIPLPRPQDVDQDVDQATGQAAVRHQPDPAA